MLPARWICLLTLPLASCIVVVDDEGWSGFHSHSVRGSGVRSEEARPVAEFRAIELETSATVRVEVGPAPSLRVSGDDNLLPLVETKVENGVLSVDLRESCRFRCGLELVVTTPALERFAIEGSGDVEIQGLAADELKLAIEGSGSIHAHGTARSLVGTIEGSGTLSLAELAAQNADLSIEGSGSMKVAVAEALHYSIEGSGDIRYSGDPDVGGEIDGSGSIEKSR